MNLSMPHILPPVREPELRFGKYLNFLLALMARRERAAEVRPLPFELTLDLSSRCQLSCPYCSVGNGTINRPAGRFSPGLHDKVLGELGPTAFIVWYFSTGEPLLNPEAAGIFRAARECGTFSVISTNLSLPLSDRRIDDLLGSGLGAVCVSLDGVSPASYSRYRVGGDFDLVVDNVARLVDRRHALGRVSPLIEWRFLVFRHNEGEMDRARAMAEGLGVDLLEFYPGSAPSDARDGEVRKCTPGTLIPGPWGPALRQPRRDTFLHRKLGSSPAHGGVVAPSVRHRKCDWLYFGTAAFPGGSVGPCCVSNDEPDDFGRLDGSGSFRGIWNNERYQAARKLFLGDPDPRLVCARCPNPDAHDFQFRNTLSGVLRNAPDWVIGIVSQAPDLFFLEIDKLLLPDEISALGGPLSGLRPEAGAVERLGRVDPEDDWTGRHIELLGKLLGESVKSCREQDRILEGLLASGETQFARGDISSAMKAFQRVLRIDGTNSQALNNLGVIQWQNGDADSAMGTFQLALSLNPDDPAALANLARSAAGTGRYDLLRPDLLTVLKQAQPTNPDIAALVDGLRGNA